ncbi:M48 family metallopeptidase [Streptomyces sp. NPDC091265]|uniref:M48 family metallopeptidase n=1 Tax=unclassified Streptomyces TaxID=2593676 RepID=UPI00344CB960
MNHDSDAVCPRCHEATAASDDRFSAWCQECDWNLDPVGGIDLSPGRTRELARHVGAFDRISAFGPAAASPNVALYGALALASAVNLLTLALVGTGAWLLLVGTWPERILGAVELLTASVLRPRPGKLPEHTLDRASAPMLHEVTRRISAELGTEPVDLIAFDSHYGSRSVTVTAGMRRRRVLVLGLPLWETVTTDQRLALLACELSKAAVGRRRSARWIQTAWTPSPAGTTSSAPLPKEGVRCTAARSFPSADRSPAISPTRGK